MKKLFTILFLLASVLGAETRYLIVSGDTAKPIPEKHKAKATHTLELTAEQMKTHVSPKYFKVVDGQPVAKTLEEVQAEDLANKKAFMKKEAYRLADSLKSDFVVQNEGEKHEFNRLSQTLFLAQFVTKDNDIRVRVKGKKSIKVSKTQASSIFAEISALHNSIEDALEADLDAIETSDFSLSNLAAIKAAQEALKN